MLYRNDIQRQLRDSGSIGRRKRGSMNDLEFTHLAFDCSSFVVAID